MNRYYYDLHMHSCLSPCADDDNTPQNLVGMAALSGLNIVALTDHNTCKNCPAFFDAANAFGLIAIAGMELTTSEDIHAICLFESLEGALDFDKEIEKHRILIKNRPEIFGSQLIIGSDESIIGEDEFLLSNATDISIEDVSELVLRFGGIAYPAHIDRDANGIISVLGTFPEENDFHTVEFHSKEKIEEFSSKYNLSGMVKIVCSDAHYLSDIRDKESYFELEVEPHSFSLVRKELFKLLRGQI